jgi:hypothetical protein
MERGMSFLEASADGSSRDVQIGVIGVDFGKEAPS